jgi:transposase InsO family protein
VEAGDDPLTAGEDADDAGDLSDDDLRERIHLRTQSEREVSFRRRILHGQIDLLRAEIVARLHDRDGEESEHLAASDVERLSEILAHRGPPLELPAELERLD